MSRPAVRVALPVASLLSAVVAVLLPALLPDGGAGTLAYCHEVDPDYELAPDVVVCQLPHVPSPTSTP